MTSCECHVTLTYAQAHQEPGSENQQPVPLYLPVLEPPVVERERERARALITYKCIPEWLIKLQAIIIGRNYVALL